MWIKQTNEAGQYIDAAGVRCDLISAGVVDFAPVHPEYSERELLAEAMEELGLRLYRSVYASGDWADKERLITAAYALIPAEAIASVMTTPAALKDAIAGLALLSTGAAPDGMINLADPRVSQWLALAGLTLEQVKAKMEVA